MVTFNVVEVQFDNADTTPTTPVPTRDLGPDGLAGTGDEETLPPPGWDWAAAFGSVERYWAEVSGGRERPTVQWHNPPLVRVEATGAERPQMDTRVLRERVVATGQASESDHLIMIRNNHDNDIAGQGYQDGPLSVAMTRIDPATICHEIGHFFHGVHACQIVESEFAPSQYEDLTCIMGAAGRNAFSFPDGMLQPLPGGTASPTPAQQTLTGPRPSPAAVDVMGSVGTDGKWRPWLDHTSPAVATLQAPYIGIPVWLAPWLGAPPERQTDDLIRVLVLEGAAREGGRMYVSLRRADGWDAGFPDPLTLTLHERGVGPVNLLVGQLRNPQPGDTLHTDRSGFAVRVLDLRGDQVRVQLIEDPWRGGYALQGWNFDNRLASAAHPGARRLDVFGIDMGTPPTLVNRCYELEAWHEWEPLPGPSLHPRSAVAAVAPSPGRVDVFVVGVGGDVHRRIRRDGGWGTWERIPVAHLGGLSLRATDSSLAATALGPDAVFLAATGSRGEVYCSRLADDGELTWMELPSVGEPMGCVAVARDTVDDSVWVHAVFQGVADARVWSYDMRRGNAGEWELRLVRPEDMFDPRAGIAAVGAGLGQYVVTATEPLTLVQRTMGQWPDQSGWGHEPTVAPMNPPDSSVAIASRDGASLDMLFVGNDNLIHGQGYSHDPSYRTPSRQLTSLGAVSIQSPSGLFLSAAGGGGGGVRADRAQVGPWERFEMFDTHDAAGDGGDPEPTVAFRASDGRHLLGCRNWLFGNNVLTAESLSVDDWEVFVEAVDLPAPPPPGARVVRFRTFGGTWLRDFDGSIVAWGTAESAGRFVVRNLV